MKFFNTLALSLLSMGSLSLGAEAQDLSLWGRCTKRVRSYFPSLMTNEEFKEYCEKEFTRLITGVNERLFDSMFQYENYYDLSHDLAQSFLCEHSYLNKKGLCFYSAACYLENTHAQIAKLYSQLNKRSLGSTVIARDYKRAHVFLGRWIIELTAMPEYSAQKSEYLRLKALDDLNYRLDALQYQIDQNKKKKQSVVHIHVQQVKAAPAPKKAVAPVAPAPEQKDIFREFVEQGHLL